jgi:hypothetical protein
METVLVAESGDSLECLDWVTTLSLDLAELIDPNLVHVLYGFSKVGFGQSQRRHGSLTELLCRLDEAAHFGSPRNQGGGLRKRSPTMVCVPFTSILSLDLAELIDPNLVHVLYGFSKVGFGQSQRRQNCFAGLTKLLILGHQETKVEASGSEVLQWYVKLAELIDPNLVHVLYGFSKVGFGQSQRRHGI